MNLNIHSKICQQYYSPQRVIHNALYLFDLNVKTLQESERSGTKVINRMQYTAALYQILYLKSKSTLKQIGEYVNRDHSTVIARIKAHESMMFSCSKYRESYYTRLEMFSNLVTIKINTSNEV